MGKSVSNTSDILANPHQVGAGEMSPIKALDPCLVVETSIVDHLYFLCYKQRTIRSLSKTWNFSCPLRGAAGGGAHLEPQLPNHLHRQPRPRGAGRGRWRGWRPTSESEVHAKYIESVNAPTGLAWRSCLGKWCLDSSWRRRLSRFSSMGSGGEGYNFGDIHVFWWIAPRPNCVCSECWLIELFVFWQKNYLFLFFRVSYVYW